MHPAPDDRGDQPRLRFPAAAGPHPARPILALLQLVEKLPLPRLPITSTNVKGLIQAADQAIPSDFTRFGYPAADLDALVRAAAERHERP